MIVSPSLISRLQTQHQTILSMLEGDENNIRRRVNPDKWSLYENCIHLVAYQPTFLKRMNRVVNETVMPVFERYVADDDPLFAEYLLMDTLKTRLQLQEDRKKIIDFFAQLSPAQLSKTGRHLRFGELTVVDWTEFFLLHEAHHLFTMFMLKHSN